MNGFTLSVGRDGAPLHAAAHSHHPWPDVTLAAQEAAWRDAARLLDRKWEHVFGEVIPEAQGHIARQLRLPDPSSIDRFTTLSRANFVAVVCEQADIAVVGVPAD